MVLRNLKLVYNKESPLNLCLMSPGWKMDCIHSTKRKHNSDWLSI